MGKQTSKQPQITTSYVKQHMLVNGKPVDAATASRIANAKPAPTRVAGAINPKPFSILR